MQIHPIAPQLQQPKFLTLSDFENAIRQEFCLDSGIAADVFETSVQFVTDTEPLDGGEVSYPIHDALNWTVSRFGHQARETQYAALLHQEAGSVWQAKLASPKWDRVKGRYRKYEAPVGNGSCAFLPPVPPTVRQQIAQRYGCDVPDQGSFWDWLATHPELPIVITEGAKKSLCLLSRGWIAIALYGVYAGYSAKDAWGHSAPRQLIPDLVRYAVPGRTLVLAFDQDDRQSTRAKVAQAQQRLSALLTRQGCCVRVALWQPKLGKGVDDLIVNHGENVWNTLYDNALSYEAYLQVAKLTYKPTVVLNQNYLGSLLHEIPAETRLICLQSPKGTGKTESIADLVQDAMQTGQRVLILTHRVQLGQALSDRLGVPYITELQTTETGALLGYGLCVDSLHPESQARFEAQQWKDALVVIDEAEQVIWHLLNAATDVKQHRIHILHQFQQLMAHTLNPEGCGRVILADADLSDTSINFVKRMAQQPELEPWVLINRYQPTQPWTVYAYHQGTPRQWLHALIQAIGQGHRPLVQVSGQQPGTKWGTRALERLLVRLFPALKILRIDSETVSDPDHGAYGAISNLNAILPQYDIVLASPSIETGVSIDLKGHFTSVWGAFQGLAPVDSIRQTLSRLREPVERHLWVARVGALGLIGNGTTNAYQLLKGIRQPIQGTVRVLQRVDRSIAGEFSGAHQDTATALQTWADMATRINAGLLHYREALLDGLALEGHRLIPVTALTSPNEIRAIAHVYSLLKEEADTDALDQAHAIAQFEQIP